jgi:hypothetical protein
MALIVDIQEDKHQPQTRLERSCKRFATLESKHVEEWLHAIETLHILSSCLDLKMQITNSVMKRAKEARHKFTMML